MKFELVIFDSDGVLVDSEGISNQLLCKVLNDCGLKITFKETLDIFQGKNLGDSLKILEQKSDIALPENFESFFRATQRALFYENLEPVAGVEEVLKALQIPKCVATNGPQEKVELALKITGLLPYFEGKVFSAYNVGIWKPDPGLFLYAAKTMGFSPQKTAVVEDSIAGVRAGILAGMKVFGYAPDEENAFLLKSEGARIFKKMEDLEELLK